MRSALTLKAPYYEALRRLTLELAGVKLGSDHAFIVETRLASLARDEGFESLDAMVDELFKTGQTRLAVRVVSALVERDTYFFRDRASLDTLFEVALPDLVSKRGGGQIDVLCHGCGSGQDVYSVAMRALSETAQNGHPLFGANIMTMGVDYPSQALERAEAGRYSHFDIQRGLGIRDLVTHFMPSQEPDPDVAPTRAGGDWTVKPELKDRTWFKGLHLLSDLDDIGPFHAICFRGALSHYSPAARVRVMRSLITLLRPYGYLVVGSGDNIGNMKMGLRTVEGYPNLFQRGPDTPPHASEPRRSKPEHPQEYKPIQRSA